MNKHAYKIGHGLTSWTLSGHILVIAIEWVAYYVCVDVITARYYFIFIGFYWLEAYSWFVVYSLVLSELFRVMDWIFQCTIQIRDHKLLKKSVCIICITCPLICVFIVYTIFIVLNILVKTSILCVVLRYVLFIVSVLFFHVYFYHITRRIYVSCTFRWIKMSLCMYYLYYMPSSVCFIVLHEVFTNHALLNARIICITCTLMCVLSCNTAYLKTMHC